MKKGLLKESADFDEMKGFCDKGKRPKMLWSQRNSVGVASSSKKKNLLNYFD